MAVNFLAGPRAPVRERHHQETVEHTLNGYGLIQIKPEANARDEARRIRTEHHQAAGAGAVTSP